MLFIQDAANIQGKVKALASSGPYGPLLARSGYRGQDASFYNNPMVMICATVNALLCCKQFYASLDESVQLEMLLCS